MRTRIVPLLTLALMALVGCGHKLENPHPLKSPPTVRPASTSPPGPGETVEPELSAVLLIHGGCGVIPRAEMTPAKEAEIRAGLEAALTAGYDALQQPEATSLDGVVAAIKVLEDSPLFNAGHGAVFTREGKNELDASIMDGKTKQAGAVASVTTIRNPITAAR